MKILKQTKTPELQQTTGERDTTPFSTIKGMRKIKNIFFLRLLKKNSGASTWISQFGRTTISGRGSASFSYASKCTGATNVLNQIKFKQSKYSKVFHGK